MAKWPNKSINYRAVTGGVECTMSTVYNKVSLSVSVIRGDRTQAEKEASRLLADKVNGRRAFE